MYATGPPLVQSLHQLCSDVHAMSQAIEQKCAMKSAHGSAPLRKALGNGSHTEYTGEQDAPNTDHAVLDSMAQLINNAGSQDSALVEWRDAAIFMKGGAGRRAVDVLAMLIMLGHSAPAVRAFRSTPGIGNIQAHDVYLDVEHHLRSA